MSKIQSYYNLKTIVICVGKLVCILITFKKYYSFRYVTNEYIHMLAFTADLWN